MHQLVRIALLVTFAGIAMAGDSRPTTTSPFQLKFDLAGKIPYSDALVKELLTDAQTHGDVRRGAAVFGALYIIRERRYAADSHRSSGVAMRSLARTCVRHHLPPG